MGETACNLLPTSVALPLAAALDPTSDALDQQLRRHGFAVLALPRDRRLALGTHDATFLDLFEAPTKAKARLRCSRRPTATTRSQARTSSLPLAGIGYNTVTGQGADDSHEEVITRQQFHLVADEAALALLPWRGVGAPRGLEQASRQACAELHALCTELLGALAGGRFERRRAEQAERLGGDPSVLDAFLYPAAPSPPEEVPPPSKRARTDRRTLAAEAPASVAPRCLMRTHTDPGLLTLTLASRPAGLEVLDHGGGGWVAAEAACGPDDALLLCGEALQILSGGRYRACAHRVVQAAMPRFSLVFELRLHRADPPPPTAVAKVAAGDAAASTAVAGPSPAEAAAAEAEDEEEQAHEEAVEGARAYVFQFVGARLDAGATPASVLAEFRVPDDARPPAAAVAAMPLDELAALVLCWVRACTDTHAEQQEAAAAFAAAPEHVVCSPAWADSSGRFVDVQLAGVT